MQPPSQLGLLMLVLLLLLDSVPAPQQFMKALAIELAMPFAVLVPPSAATPVDFRPMRVTGGPASPDSGSGVVVGGR